MNNNIDSAEIQKFNDIGEHWWNVNGPFKALHDINPIRLSFISQHTDLKNKTLIDIGCGGGILSESLAKAGAEVTGIDMSPAAIETASLHAGEHNLKIHYQQITAEDYAHSQVEQFDIVTCMELLEHVPDPASLISAAAALAKPGADLFFSTLNRNVKSYLFAIIGAEYVLNLLDKGTHEYAKFIRPSELTSWAEAAGLAFKNMQGMNYNPFTKAYTLTDDVSINYLIHFQKKHA
jgi:2-polyprenyl-6-hydroxyphenyl methylase/3-demethylubiquinone-9 3-methyltransferase